MIPIHSSQNPKFKAACRLESSRGRKQQGRFVIHGLPEIRRAFAAKIEIMEVYFCRELVGHEPLAEIDTLAQERRLPRYELPADLFRKLSFGERLDGAVAIAARPKTDLASLPRIDEGFVIVLEGVEKPGNVGAVARTAVGAGARALILANPLTDFFHPNSIRASIGTVFALPLATSSSAEVQQWLRQHQFAIYPAIVDSGQSLWDIHFREKSAIVMGNESQGLSAAWRGADMQAIHLPMLGSADSLNVSCSAAAIAFEIARQRFTRQATDDVS